MTLRARLEGRAGAESYPHRSLVVVEQNAFDIGLNENVEIVVFAALKLRVQIRMRHVCSLAIRLDVSHHSLNAVDGVEIVDILELWPASIVDGLDKIVGESLGAISRCDADGTFVPMAIM